MPRDTRPTRSREPIAERTVLLIASLGVFMAFVDSTAVSIAFPDMLRSFPDSQIDDLSWIFNIYNVTLGALLIPAGRLADVIGRRRTFSIGVWMFTIASGLCAIAPTLTTLVIARAIQGVGAAVMIPTSLALVLHAYPDEQRKHAVALWTAVAALAAGIGPSLGGFLVNMSGWQLVFLVNIPIGIITLRLTKSKLIESRAPGRRQIPDLPGAALLALAIGSLILAIVQAEQWGWLGMETITAFVTACVLAAAFAYRSSNHASPVVEFSMFRSRRVAVTGAMTFIGGAGYFAIVLANVLYMTEVWGYSALTAGLAMTPGPFFAALAAGTIGRLADHRDPRLLIFVGALLWASGPLFLIAAFTTAPAFLTAFLPAALILAAGVGIVFPLVAAIAVADADGGKFGAATAMNSAVRQIGAAFGVALLVVLLGNTTAANAESAFTAAWIFSSICFLFVAVAALFIGRVPDIAPAESFSAGLRETLGKHRRTASEVKVKPRSKNAQPVPPRAAAASVDELIAEIPLFASLPAEQRAGLADRAEVQTVSSGEWLFRKDDPADGLYVVQTGRLEIVDEAGEVIREIASGSALGELGLIAQSPRTASVRAARDSRLLKISRDDFDAAVKESPEFSHELLRTLGSWLASGGPRQERAGRPPSSVAVVAFDGRCERLHIADRLATAVAEYSSCVTVNQSILNEHDDAGIQVTEMLDRAERERQHLILDGGSIANNREWAEICIRQADRTIFLMSRTPSRELLADWQLPRNQDLVIVGDEWPIDFETAFEGLAPNRCHPLREGDRFDSDLAAIAREISGHSVGLVLSGGGARGFAHLGVIEALRDAGVRVDRIAGTSMGAFIGALLASEKSPEEIDAICFEEWVRSNPVSDYTVPRTSLIRGRRVEAMLERVFDGSIERLPRDFFCVSVDINSAEAVYHRSGPLVDTVGASMSLPIIAPPRRFDGRLLVDGGVVDNLPTARMAEDRRGPIIAVDVSERPDRTAPDLTTSAPTLVESLYKVMILSAKDQAQSRSLADLVIDPKLDGIGLLEFHMIDEARAAGYRSAAEALDHAPDSIFT